MSLPMLLRSKETTMKAWIITPMAALLFLVGAARPILANDPRDLVGIWKIEIQEPRNGTWKTMSWATVGLQNGKPVMAGIEFSAAPDAASLGGVTNIQVRNEQWSFTSRVDGRSYQFALKKVSPTQYEGRCAINGQLQSPARRLVKIVDNRQLRDELDALIARLEVARVTTEQLIAKARQEQQFWQNQAER